MNHVVDRTELELEIARTQSGHMLQYGQSGTHPTLIQTRIKVTPTLTVNLT